MYWSGSHQNRAYDESQRKERDQSGQVYRREEHGPAGENCRRCWVYTAKARAKKWKGGEQGWAVTAGNRKRRAQWVLDKSQPEKELSHAWAVWLQWVKWSMIRREAASKGCSGKTKGEEAKQQGQASLEYRHGLKHGTERDVGTLGRRGTKP